MRKRSEVTPPTNSPPEERSSVPPSTTSPEETALDRSSASRLTPSVTIAGNRISDQWGKSTFPIAPYANFSVGEFYRSTELAEGDDAVAVARAMLAELRAIADHAFAEQLAWYEEKFEKLSK